MEQRNMILAFVLSMIVLVGWQVIFPAAEKHSQQTHAQTATKAASSASRPSQASPPVMQGHSGQVKHAILTPEAPMKNVPKIASLKNSLLDLKIDSRGAIIEAQTTKYRESIKPGSGPVAVLERNGEHAIYVNSGLIGQGVPNFHVVSKKEDQGDAILTLGASLADGRSWIRTITLKHGSYVLDVNDRITHGSGLEMYRQVVEINPDQRNQECANIKARLA